MIIMICILLHSIFVICPSSQPFIHNVSVMPLSDCFYINLFLSTYKVQPILSRSFAKQRFETETDRVFLKIKTISRTVSQSEVAALVLQKQPRSPVQTTDTVASPGGWAEQKQRTPPVVTSQLVVVTLSALRLHVEDEIQKKRAAVVFKYKQ